MLFEIGMHAWEKATLTSVFLLLVPAHRVDLLVAMGPSRRTGPATSIDHCVMLLARRQCGLR
jgi:hypothetical protein